MKLRRLNNFLRRAALISAALLAWCCNPDAKLDPSLRQEVQGMRTVHFRALQPQTKAQFGAQKNGAWPTLWTANDS